MDGFDHFRKVRGELVRLYEFMTDKQFPVIAPRSVFLTTRQLENIEKNPPPGGTSRFSRRIEMHVSIQRIVNAYEIGGSEFEMGFARPKTDIPLIYEAIQEYVRLWVDIKINSYNYQTADIKELRALEAVSRSLFSIYKYYREMDEQEKMRVGTDETEFALANLNFGHLQYGLSGFKDIGFVSYVDQYYEKLQSHTDSTTMYIDPYRYQEPERQQAITEMFELPKMQHSLGNWS